MANTLRGLYGTDVLIAPASSFTGSVLQADYTQTTARAMIMPNGLMSYRRTMTGAELKDTLRVFVEGCEGGFVPFNRGSLPVVSGIAVEVKRGKRQLYPDRHHPERTAAPGRRHRYRDLSGSGKSDGSAACERERHVFGRRYMGKNRWRDHLSGGGAALAEPENYMTLR